MLRRLTGQQPQKAAGCHPNGDCLVNGGNLVYHARNNIHFSYIRW